MSEHCGRPHPITGYRCRRPLGHDGDHGARCRLRGCGGYGTDHRWPNDESFWRAVDATFDRLDALP